MKEWKFAFYQTLPVLAGYLFLGIAFGLLLSQAGYGFLWAFFISLTVYAGSMQFVLLGFLGSPIGLFSVLMTTFSVNCRHIFYGVSFLEQFRRMGKSRPYMIFSLTDETYSILSAAHVPETLEHNKVFLYISLLDHLYWVSGSVLGAVAGQLIPADLSGIDFAMTALFVVLFVEQVQTVKARIPAAAGFLCAVLCLLVFGPGRFLLPTLLLVIGILFLTRKQIQGKEGDIL